MNRQGSRRLLLFALCTAFMTGGQAAGDAAAGKLKALSCLGCHGVPGYFNVYPSYHVPKVGGQHEEYLIAALKEYRAGTRSHPTMGAQAATLSDEDIADIAAFVASNKGE